jgi:hypothetical protein
MPLPGEGELHNPSPGIAPQFPPVLMRRPRVVPPRGNDRLKAPPGQPSAQGITVIPPIRNQPLGPPARASGLAGAADGDRLDGGFEARDFRWGRRVQVCSQRRTRAIDQHHPLCALAVFRLADLGAPFSAGTKLPSTKHSSQRIFSWSLSWAKKARQSLSSTPVSSHCLSRRQQALGLPYRRGNALHGAPVQRIQRMPSKQRRSGTRGRPPRRNTFGGGR